MKRKEKCVYILSGCIVLVLTVLSLIQQKEHMTSIPQEFFCGWSSYGDALLTWIAGQEDVLVKCVNQNTKSLL